VEQVSEHEALAREFGQSFAYASGSESFFIKKESVVSWRERLRNAWDGFGWCATAVREAAMLQALRGAGIGCPEVVALGEDGRRAFVVTRAETTMMELRDVLRTVKSDDERGRIASALGQELAKMHDAGFDHPDLFAKHILVGRDQGTVRFCILDWQRGRRRRAVPWRVRCRDLAMLDATLHLDLADDRLRMRLLSAYRRAVARRDAPPLRRLVRQIRRMSETLSQKNRVREIGGLPIPAADQQFVSLQCSKLLIVRSYYEELSGDIPGWLLGLAETDVGAMNSDECELHACPGESAMPALAHELFRRQRLGLSGPQLLAVAFSERGAIVVTRRNCGVETEAVA
jgi:tRNA A-37 threonylcarbamoyl transferase component Bud32